MGVPCRVLLLFVCVALVRSAPAEPAAGQALDLAQAEAEQATVTTTTEVTSTTTTTVGGETETVVTSSDSSTPSAPDSSSTTTASGKKNKQGGLDLRTYFSPSGPTDLDAVEDPKVDGQGDREVSVALCEACLEGYVSSIQDVSFQMDDVPAMHALAYEYQTLAYVLKCIGSKGYPECLPLRFTNLLDTTKAMMAEEAKEKAAAAAAGGSSANLIQVGNNCPNGGYPTYTYYGDGSRVMCCVACRGNGHAQMAIALLEEDSVVHKLRKTVDVLRTKHTLGHTEVLDALEEHGAMLDVPSFIELESVLRDMDDGTAEYTPARQTHAHILDLDDEAADDEAFLELDAEVGSWQCW